MTDEQKTPDEPQVDQSEVAKKGKGRATKEAEFVENPRYGVKVTDER